MVYFVLYGKQPHFPKAETKFQVKGRMECGWVQAENLYLVIIFSKNSRKSPGKPWKNFNWMVATLFLLNFLCAYQSSVWCGYFSPESRAFTLLKGGRLYPLTFLSIVIL